MSTSPTKIGSAPHILDGLSAKNQSAFDALYGELKGLKNVFQRHLGSDDARDLYGELIGKLVASVSDGRFRSPSALYGYANVVAHRMVNDARAKWVKRNDLLRDGPVNRECDHRAAERRETARGILGGMPDREREALMRYHLEEQSPEEICGDLNLTAAQFGLIRCRARQMFADAQSR